MGVGIVLVTFNRLEKLKIALAKYEMQTYSLDYILIVDNHSSDGTSAYLSEWKNKQAKFKKYVFTLDSNTGGAGGFYKGMEEAVKLESEWIWLSDDDAYPRSDCIEKLIEFYNNNDKENKNNIAALCSAVYNNNEIHFGHRNHLRISALRAFFVNSSVEEYQENSFEIDVFSYVGAMIKKSILKEIGFDRKEFFIYCDDQEHSIRISRKGKIYVIPSSKIDHDTPPSKGNQINWGRYYKKRNELLMMKYNFPARYYLLKYIKGYIRDVSIFSKSAPILKEELRAAYVDAKNNRTGIHELYKPGWNPNDFKN